MQDRFQLHVGDCLEVLRTMPDNSVDSIVTDPPYGLSFMGKRWDYDVPSEAIWRECLRVLKPGGHLLAFAGTRTQHRMAVRIEDAGFEIRDMIAWVYGGGFPKSLDVSKAIDKAAGAEREVSGMYQRPDGKPRNVEEWSAVNRNTYSPADQIALKTKTAPATEAARQWQGWGTALKPALEPITVARKPLVGTVAANVLEWGTGGINIDACRVEGEQWASQGAQNGGDTLHAYGDGLNNSGRSESHPHGRWPANLIHDGSDEVVAQFPETKSGGYPPEGGQRSQVSTYGKPTARGEQKFTSSEGSAARFFYCAKASRKDRNEGVGSSDTPAVGAGATMREREDADWPTRNGNHHPTVKPTDLMRYLVRLVTPPGGVVLDPFMGSGSTGKACMRDGFRFIGCDLSAEYAAIARSRIEHELAKMAPPAEADAAGETLPLFSMEAA